MRLKHIYPIIIATLVGGCSDADNSAQNSIAEPNKSTITQNVSTNQALAYVPADTVFFYGGKNTFNLQAILDEIPFFKDNKLDFSGLAQAEQNKIDEKLAQAVGESPAGNILSQLYIAYLKNLDKPQLFLKKMGVAPQPSFAIYSVGASPVMRFQLDQNDNFKNILEQAELKSGSKAITEQVGNLSVKRYPFEKGDKNTADLLLTQQGDQMVMAVQILPDTSISIESLLGVNKPKQSLESSDKLSQIISKYNFDPSLIFYLDHKILMTGLTTVDGNSLSHSITALDSKANDLANLRTTECQTDYQNIANDWPMSLGGYSPGSLVPGSTHYKFTFQLEMNDQNLLSQLQSLRGNIPEFIDNNSADSLLDLALGVNIAKLSPVITSIWTEMTQKEYQCPDLIKMQQELAKKNPAMLGMGTAVVASLKGISFSLQDIKMNMVNNKPQLENIDALISISSNEPKTLLGSGALFLPTIPNSLPEDGSAVELSTPIPLPNGLKLQPKIAMRDQSIVVFTDSKSELLSNKLAGKPSQNNGLFVLNMDYAGYMKIISRISDNYSQDTMSDEEKKLLSSITTLDIEIQEKFDFNKQGFAVEVEITLN
ncbi:MAG: hypothetical protein ACWA5R_11225 [bacterium]